MLRNHRSIRKYKERDIPEEIVQEIVRAAQAAPTSSNIQAYSVVAVRNPEKKRQFAELAGRQPQIEQCSVFLVWCADLNKIRRAIRLHEDKELEQNTELFLLATIDAALAAQNAVVAAESLGYGTVYIGGIRNNPQAATDLLALPRYVYPVFGMCVGVPDQEPDLRPRLPLSAVYHREVYEERNLESDIRQYDEVMRHYYATRKGGGKGGEQETIWSREMLRRFNGERHRGHMYAFLHDRGFELR